MKNSVIPTIVSVVRNQGRLVTADPESEIKEAMRELAQKLAASGGQADYLFLNDPLVSGLVSGNQSFFDSFLKEALAAVGLTLEIRGVSGGNINRIWQLIRERFPAFNGEGTGRSDYPLLYEVIRKS